MSASDNDVVITGIGIVSAHGIGRGRHEAILTAPQCPSPHIDTHALAPYTVHPLPEIDWSAQIPRRGDQRQMETWQRLGVFTAGLALDDAGLKQDGEACARMDMIVAAGGGERDIAVDTLIVEAAGERNDREIMLNEKLTSELRPTLFLAQLSNLLAGNISIVHKVTGSSRTFMGEEAAGISALETAWARIRAGQSTHALVGAASALERPDVHLVIEAIGGLATGPFRPVWSRRTGPGGGVMLGSAAAFIVLESRVHAAARKAPIYAVLQSVAGDRGRREDGGLEARLDRLADETGAAALVAPLVMSGACGLIEPTESERDWLARRFAQSPVRGYAGLTGHTIETQFPLGVALAALALRTGARLPVFDPDGEAVMGKPAAHALVTTIGHAHGEGIAVLGAEGDMR